MADHPPGNPCFGRLETDHSGHPPCPHRGRSNEREIRRVCGGLRTRKQAAAGRDAALVFAEPRRKTAP